MNTQWLLWVVPQIGPLNSNWIQLQVFFLRNRITVWSLWDYGDTWWYFGVWVVLDLYSVENDVWCWKWWFMMRMFWNVIVMVMFFVVLICHAGSSWLFIMSMFVLWWWLCFMVFHDGWSYVAMFVISNMFYELEPSAPWAPGYYGDSAAVAQCAKHIHTLFSFEGLKHTP